MKPWFKKMTNLLAVLCGLSLLTILMIQLKKESLGDSQGDLKYFEKIVESRKEMKVTIPEKSYSEERIRRFAEHVLFKGIPTLKKEQAICRKKLFFELESKRWSFSMPFESAKQFRYFFKVIKRHFRSHKNAISSALSGVNYSYGTGAHKS